jgi:hypothetical protein
MKKRRNYGVGRTSSVRRRGVTREDESLGQVRIRLEEPFLATWLLLSQKDIPSP